MRPSTAATHRTASIEILRTAIELGVQLVDTAFLYGWGVNEELVAAALHPYAGDVLIATKIAIDRAGVPGAVARPGPPGPGEYTPSGRPDALRRQAEGALRRLRANVAASGISLKADHLRVLDALGAAGAG